MSYYPRIQNREIDQVIAPIGTMAENAGGLFRPIVNISHRFQPDLYLDLAEGGIPDKMAFILAVPNVPGNRSETNPPHVNCVGCELPSLPPHWVFRLYIHSFIEMRHRFGRSAATYYSWIVRFHHLISNSVVYPVFNP